MVAMVANSPNSALNMEVELLVHFYMHPGALTRENTKVGQKLTVLQYCAGISHVFSHPNTSQCFTCCILQEQKLGIAIWLEC